MFDRADILMLNTNPSVADKAGILMMNTIASVFARANILILNTNLRVADKAGILMVNVSSIIQKKMAMKRGSIEQEVSHFPVTAM